MKELVISYKTCLSHKLLWHQRVWKGGTCDANEVHQLTGFYDKMFLRHCHAGKLGLKGKLW